MPARKNKPTVDWDSNPLMRLVSRILRQNRDENQLKGPGRLTIFNAIFESELGVSGFLNNKIAYFDSFDSQWREREKTDRDIAKCPPILKKPEDMTAKEAWAYLWAYELIRIIAEEERLPGPIVRPWEWKNGEYTVLL